MELTESQAIQLYESKWWEGLPEDVVVGFQLFQERLCMPWDDFQLMVDRVLGRPTWTHEYASPEHLHAEYLKERPAPTLQEIMDMVPADKRIVISVPSEPAP